MEEKDMPQEGSTIIVGLSGGADSVALLYFLKSLHYRCIAAHCNFHLRGDESMRDEVFSEILSASLNIPFLKIDFDTHQYATENGISIEMAARELRYTWFDQLLIETDAAAIAVAHHRDDNVETLLLNLVRGTGIRGLTGMKPKVNKIIRPLLCLTKEEVLSYLESKEASYVTDSTNLKSEFVRNKIRLQIIPAFETVNPSVKDSITRAIDNLQQVFKVYDSSIEEAKKRVFEADAGRISISLLKNYSSPEALLYEILSGFGFNNIVIKEIIDTLDSQSGKEFFSSGYRVLKDRDFLLLVPLNTKNDCLYEIQEGDKCIQEPLSLSIRCEDQFELEKIRKDKNIIYLDADKLQFPLVIRRWQSGDKFVPFGMKGSQKLSDYFNNNKFSKLEKEEAWVLCSGSDIVWIIGKRADNRYKICQNTRKTCIIELFS